LAQRLQTMLWQGNNMSYILEALKKAQAERQLGELPTIHAPHIYGAASDASAGGRKPVWLKLGALSLAAVVMLSVLAWRQPWQAAVQAPPAVPVKAVPAAPLPALTVALAKTAAPTPVPVPSPAPVPAPVPAAALAAPKPKLEQPRPTPVAVAAVAAATTPKPEPQAPAAASDDGVLTLRELPEPIQRQIPPMVLGGYIYSKNPADRLLLIDKVLRHEGEELAPGLMLEKLQPKSAVFSYQGYRYRVPY